jgi:dihydropyrimidine dehydrogenase (NAD+) subunit PreA
MKQKIDLSVTFTGIKFKNPFIVSSAPPSRTPEMIERAFKAGWAGVSIKTATPDYADIVDVQPRLRMLRTESGDRYGFENIELIGTRPLEMWAKDIKRLREQYPENVIISSLMAPPDKDKWQEAVKIMQNAGAQAIEINGSCPHGMPERGMGSHIGQDPRLAAKVTSWVKEVAEVPVWFKLTPNVTDIAKIAIECKKAGADAFSAINTIIGLGDIDIDTFIPNPNVAGRSTYGGHSGPMGKPIALKAIAEVARKTGMPVSGMNGIQTWKDAVQFMLAGAGTLQCCSVIMWKGYDIIRELSAGLEQYLEEKGLHSPQEIVGRALPNIGRHTQLARNIRIKPVRNDKCIACGACYISCRDGGFQAISMVDGRPVTDYTKCTGCSLCAQVCENNAITLEVKENGEESKQK